MLKKLFCACLVPALFLSVTPAVAAEGEGRRLTVMGLGDSITEGGDSFSTYLYPLWELLFAGGYDADFIGPRQSECRIGRLSHCGFSGQTVEFLDERIDSLYRRYPADVVLLHAGHNHFADRRSLRAANCPNIRTFRS